jgi:hypothetical protein
MIEIFIVQLLLVHFFVVSLEVSFQKAQRIDSRAAALANRGSLVRFSHRHFPEHGGE